MKYSMLGLLFLCAGSSAIAQETTQEPVQMLDITIPSDKFALNPDSDHLMLAQLASSASLPPPALATVPEMTKTRYEPRPFTANNAHKYLGLGSMALAIATVIASEGSDEDKGGNSGGNSLHRTLGTGAATLGVAAVATGLAFHYDDLKFSNGLRDPDNLHALLGTLGTLGYLYAVTTAGKGGHAAAGILGAASMFFAIKLTW